MDKNYKYDFNNKLCDFFSTIPITSKHNFIPSDFKKLDIKKLKKIDSSTYFLLNNYHKSFGEQNYVYGKFKITENRFGVICYNKTREDDRDVNFFSLHIIENCSKSKEFRMILFHDYQTGNFYESTSSFNKTFDVITVSLNESSEWAINSKIDTMFTHTYKIDLKSKNFDTIYNKSTFKIFKK